MIEDLQTVANCLKFEEIEEEYEKFDKANFITFTNDGDESNSKSGCWSYLGQQGGEQVLSENILEYLAKYFIEIF